MQVLNKVDETDYTSELKKAIDTEVNKLSKSTSPSSITPHSTKQKATDVYLTVGFENLSHFSFAFKKAFGVSPRSIINR